MNLKSLFNSKGLTIIELMVALVIFAIVIAGIYRLFVAQSKAYTVQDQVVETQQSLRSSMEILLNDLRMSGFDNDALTSNIEILTPLIAGTDQITVNYEFDNTTQYSVRYWRDAGSQELRRQLTRINDAGSDEAGPVETLLENVEELNFTYGIDTDDDKALDAWVQAGASGVGSIVAVRVRLTARPKPPATEDQKMISPRTLETAVTLRNLCMR
jgi:prepilin-type N-terminal cleavage/methylation domain-containing protein